MFFLGLDNIMTLKQAQQMDCPYKPRSIDLLTGQSLSKCTGSPCMCWVEGTNPTYNYTKTIYGTYEDRTTFLANNPSYVLIETRYHAFNECSPIHAYIVGIPTTEPQGYCTLRGDI